MPNEDKTIARLKRLLPCPFCGKVPVQQDGYLAGISGRQPGWYCSGHTMEMTEAEWNTRVNALPMLLQRAEQAKGAREAAIEALAPFAACVEQIALDESDEEWAKFRLLIADFRRASDAIEALKSTPPVKEE